MGIGVSHRKEATVKSWHRKNRKKMAELTARRIRSFVRASSAWSLEMDATCERGVRVSNFLEVALS